MEIIRNIQNNDVYEKIGDNKYRNLRTLKEGVVTDEMALKVFEKNQSLTELINEYPMIKELINKLNLRFNNT